MCIAAAWFPFASERQKSIPANPRRRRLDRQPTDARPAPGVKALATPANYSEAASNSPIQDLFRVCEQPNTNLAEGGCRNHDGRSPAGFLLGRRGGFWGRLKCVALQSSWRVPGGMGQRIRCLERSRPQLAGGSVKWKTANALCGRGRRPNPHRWLASAREGGAVASQRCQ